MYVLTVDNGVRTNSGWAGPSRGEVLFHVHIYLVPLAQVCACCISYYSPVYIPVHGSVTAQ